MLPRRAWRAGSMVAYLISGLSLLNAPKIDPIPDCPGILKSYAPNPFGAKSFLVRDRARGQQFLCGRFQPGVHDEQRAKLAAGEPCWRDFRFASRGFPIRER